SARSGPPCVPRPTEVAGAGRGLRRVASFRQRPPNRYLTWGEGLPAVAPAKRSDPERGPFLRRPNLAWRSDMSVEHDEAGHRFVSRQPNGSGELVYLLPREGVI